jgi:light-regulated signal transduction histidine kinase (bacteriophytochrome)
MRSLGCLDAGIRLETRVRLELDGRERPHGDRRPAAPASDHLVSNAIKFTPPQGQVSVRLAFSHSHARITVHDTGHGISPEALAAIFERFGQDGRPGLEARGLGLGLAIVQHLVEVHGGTAAAESAGVGRGDVRRGPATHRCARARPRRSWLRA